MLRINQISRLLGTISITAVSVYIIKLLSRNEYSFSSYVIVNACVGLMAIVEFGAFNIISHNLTSWFAKHGVNFTGGIFLVFSRIKYRLAVIVIAFVLILSHKDLFVWWIAFLPVFLYVKRCIQTVEQAAFSDYRFWVREFLFSIVKLFILSYIDYHQEIRYLDVFAVLILTDLLFIISYVSHVSLIFAGVPLELEHKKTYQYSFTSNYLSNQAESIFPIFFLSSAQIIVWGLVMPFVSISKQISSSIMGANFAYIQSKKSSREYVVQMLFMLGILDLSGLSLAVICKPFIVGVFGVYIEQNYMNIVMLSIAYFSALMCNSIFGDWLRKVGRMSFIKHTSNVGVTYILGFLGIWWFGVFESIEIYFVGKVISTLIMLLLIMHEFRKSIYS